MSAGRVRAATSRFAAPSSVCLYGNDSDFWTSDDEGEEEEEDEDPSSSSSQQVPDEGSCADAQLKQGVSQIPSPGSGDSSFLDKLGSPEQLAVPPPDAQSSFFPVLPSPYAASFYEVSSRKEVYPWRQEDEENLLRYFGMLQGNDEDVKTEGNLTTTSPTHQRATSPSSSLPLQASTVSTKASGAVAEQSPSMFSSSKGQKEQQEKGREEGGLRFLPSAPCDVSTVNNEVGVLVSWEEEEEDLGGGGARGKREKRLENFLSSSNDKDLLPPFSSSVSLGAEEDGAEEGEERSPDTSGIQFFFFPPLNSEASNLLFNPFSSSSSQPCQEKENLSSYLNKPPPPLVEILPPHAFPYFSESVPAVGGGRDEGVLQAPPLVSQSSPCERRREDDEEQAKATALASIEALCVTAPQTPTSSSSLSSSSADACTTVLSSPSPTGDDQALSSSIPSAQDKTGVEEEKKVSPIDKLKAPRGGYIRKHWCVEDNTSDVTLFRRKLQAVRRERARILRQTEGGTEGGGNRDDPSKTKKTDGTRGQVAGGFLSGENEGRGGDFPGRVNENEEGEADREKENEEEDERGEQDDEALEDGGVEIRYEDLDETMKSWLASIPQEPGDLSPLQVPLALEFPFLLDDFQKRAILHLEKYQTVFVAAHTSAGMSLSLCLVVWIFVHTLTCRHVSISSSPQTSLDTYTKKVFLPTAPFVIGVQSWKQRGKHRDPPGYPYMSVRATSLHLYVRTSPHILAVV